MKNEAYYMLDGLTMLAGFITFLAFMDGQTGVGWAGVMGTSASLLYIILSWRDRQ